MWNSETAKATFNIGTRGSQLALWQAEHVRDLLAEMGIEAEIVIIQTQGDRIRDRPFSQMEGKGFFTKELEEAQLDGRVDLAVHSLKDMSTEMPQGLTLAALVGREDSRDVLLARPEAIDAERLEEDDPLPLRQGAVVGTSAARRQGQLRHLRPDLEIKDLRGNVPTRIERLRQGFYDAILLAQAGLERLGISTEGLVVRPLDPDRFVPAPGQGMLGVQCRAEGPWRERLAQLHCAGDGRAVLAERDLLERLEGGCQLPFGVNISRAGDRWRLAAFLAPPDEGNEALQLRLSGADLDELVESAWQRIHHFQERGKEINMSNSSWWERATRVLPGGVDSPVRAFKSVPGDPIFFKSASGSRFTDEEERTFIDYCMSWGPLILGHADPDVQSAVEEAIAEGTSFGAPSRREVLLAEAFLERVPLYEQVRFVNSGTEAVMSAIRLARGFTGRDMIVKFAGCYHGHADSLLVEAGSGLATFGTPSSGGVPADFTRHTAVLPLDDDEALSAFFAEHGDEVAALILEPVPANSGLLIQRPEFLKLCRELTEKHGALLIYDEVITGFRVGPGGAAPLQGITPDMGTFGKIIGGGFPVGAYATRKEIMDHISPTGGVYQAGTLSGNPVAMAAGLAALTKTGRPGFYEELERKGALLEAGLNQAASRNGVTATVVRLGSLFWTAFQPEAPRRFDAIDGSKMETYGRLHRALIERGVYLAPSGYEVGFLSAAHSDDDISRTVDALDDVFRSWKDG